MANEIIVGLDIGTTKIACFVGMRVESGKVKILGFGRTESVGVEHGVVKSIRNGTANAGDSLSGTQDNSFITVMKSGDYRIKGSINEQNISQIAEGSPMLAVSRTDSSKTWRGTVSKIDTSNPSSGQNNGMSSDMASGSSSYPF